MIAAMHYKQSHFNSNYTYCTSVICSVYKCNGWWDEHQFIFYWRVILIKVQFHSYVVMLVKLVT